jgi:eukaryotic-like serine/threonine-protein kinase
MTLSAGTKLGTYDIVALLGSGGMGDVYRARDSKLKRDVAVKVLPDAFSSDPERVQRFQREAEVLASLNNSYIAGIYDLYEWEGSRFLILELVEGETLAELIARGSIPIDDALSISRQIAEALEAAHEKGIVHRDLKPANIKITPEGKVKVLDFGLAKVRAADGAGASISNSPTLMSGTMPGMIMGTAAYMSPEQAKGKEVDRISDLWAFGCVFYEMLAGRPAFEGETVAEVLGGIFRAEPDWSALPRDTPPAICKLLRRCLQKERKQRLHDIADARIEIDEVRPEPAETVIRPIFQNKFRFVWTAAAFVFALAFMVAVALPYFRAVPKPPEMRTDIVTPPTEDPFSFALSPDGKWFTYVASGDGQPRLWLRELDTAAVRLLAGTDGASLPFWSPDSRSIGFFAGAKLWRIDISGGAPQTLAAAPVPRGGTWSSEGVILFNPSVGPLFRVSEEGGSAKAATQIQQGQAWNVYPQFLPGGRDFLFFALGSQETQGIYVASLDSTEAHRLIAADTAGAFLAPDWLLFIRRGTLLAQRFDTAQRVLSGDPVTVAEDVSCYCGGGFGAFSVSASGLVSYRTGGLAQQRLLWVDRSGKVIGNFSNADLSGLQNPELSPDGKRVAISRLVQGNVDVWLLDSTRATRLTFDSEPDDFPIWSPDGNRIVFQSARNGRLDVYQKPTNGTGTETLLLESSQVKLPHDWSSDGRFLLYHSIDPMTGRDLWVRPMEGERKPRVFLKTNFDERWSQFSPDDRWVAYQSNESGRDEIYVRPFPEAEGQWQISADGGMQPRWSRDGKELYYLTADGKLMAVPIGVRGAVLEPGKPVALFRTRIQNLTGPTRPQYDVASDGRFLMLVVAEGSGTPITLLQNWHPEPGK